MTSVENYFFPFGEETVARSDRATLVAAMLITSPMRTVEELAAELRTYVRVLVCGHLLFEGMLCTLPGPAGPPHRFLHPLVIPAGEKVSVESPLKGDWFLVLIEERP